MIKPDKKPGGKCPYCRMIRRTHVGLTQHIRNVHPILITKSGILLPNPREKIKLITSK